MNVVVLIPAHNEEAGITEAVKSLHRQTVRPDLVIVVADNCNDRTVERARDAGAQVVESVGNTAFAAHRAGHGNPFIDFDLLRPGDLVLMAQGETEWRYRITTEPVIIEPHEAWVLDPWREGRTLTLTTCWPKYGSSHRMYVRAVMERSS